MRKSLPRFSGTHLENNQQLAGAFARFATEKNCTPAQLALAWVLAQGNHIIPIPGTRRRVYLEENAGAVKLQLNPSDLERIESLLQQYPDVGSRYNEQLAKLVGK